MTLTEGKLMERRWKYKVVELDPMLLKTQVQDELNKLGEDGWELVSVTPIPSGWTKYYLKKTT